MAESIVPILISVHRLALSYVKSFTCFSNGLFFVYAISLLRNREETSNVFGETENCGIGSIAGSGSDELLSLLQEIIKTTSSAGMNQYLMWNKSATMIIKLSGRAIKASFENHEASLLN